MFVWKAMPSMTAMMSPIFFDEALMAPMVSTTWLTTPPAWLATCEAEMANWLAWRALSAFWRTVDVISSMVDAVSSSEPACCSVRADRSWLPEAISPDAVEIDSASVRTWLTRWARLSRMALIAISKLDVSPGRVSMCVVRSPWAICATMAAA
ncbi:hypothetical protein D3C85_887820 [compost metagenome]